MRILGNVIVIPPALDRYLAIKREFRTMSETTRDMVLSLISADTFGEAWQTSESASIPEGICIWGKQFGRAALKCVVEKGVSTLTENGCYSVDESRYEDEYLDASEIDACAESGSVMMALKQLESDEYEREIARQNRTERWGNAWVGGTLGGGIKGALKGALKAELMNAGGALASGAINKVSRGRSRDKMLESSERLFDLFRLELAEVIRIAVMSNVDGYVRCLKECLQEDISDEWPGQDKDAAKGILGNLADGRIPEGKRKDAIGKLVQLDPFSSEAYDWIYRNEKSLREEVESLADYFCVEVDAIEEARREKAEAARKRAKKRAKQQREQRRIAQEADEAQRTAFGKVWPTIEEMEIARADKAKFLECVERLVADYSSQDGFAGARLTEKKIAKIQAVFETLPGERVIWLLDTSAWYTANYGLIVTDKGLRWKNRDAKLSKISCLSWKEFGEFDKKPLILENNVLRLAKGAWVDMDVNISWKEKWLPVVVSLWSFWREGTFEKNDEEMVPCAVSSPQPDVVCESGSSPTDLAKRILDAVADVGGGLYCIPNIPEKKLINAKVAMLVPPGEAVIALMDTTFFGSAKTGVVLTDWGVRWTNDWATDSKRTALSWPELRACRPYSATDCKLTLTEGAVIGTAGGGMSAANLSKVIETVAGRYRT